MAVPTPPPAAGPSDLPDTSSISRAVDEVLARPEFRPESEGLMERLWNGVLELLDDVFGGLFSSAAEFLGGDGLLARLVFWWMVLVLAAIVGHFVWTLLQLRQPRTATAGGPGGAGGPPVNELPDASSALDDARALAASGRFADAMHALYAGTLHWLDTAGQLRFEESKTGGDYVRELSASPHRPFFRRILAVFYPVAFGGRIAQAQAFREMRASASAMGVPE